MNSSIHCSFVFLIDEIPFMAREANGRLARSLDLSPKIESINWIRSKIRRMVNHFLKHFTNPLNKTRGTWGILF